MKIHYFADTDTLYITIRETASSDSGDVGPDVLADYDDEGAIVALTIEHASVHADLGSVDVGMCRAYASSGMIDQKAGRSVNDPDCITALTSRHLHRPND